LFHRRQPTRFIESRQRVASLVCVVDDRLEVSGR